MNRAERILNELLDLPVENEVVEWKGARDTFDTDKLGKYFSALSNEANLRGIASAWLIFGVENDRSVEGTQYRSDRARLDSLKYEIAKETTNGITFIEIHEVTVDGKRVLLFEIPSAPRGMPVGWKGHYYARSGESICPLSIHKIERLRAQSGLEDWSAGVCEGASIEDLAPEALHNAREAYGRKHPEKRRELTGWDDETFLNKAKLTLRGKVTRTAILLLGKSEAEHYINPSSAKISWILKSKENIERDYAHFSCPLIRAVDRVFDKIRNLKYRYIKDGTLFPEEVDRYDPLTIREALNNCIAHQDYTLGGKINVIEYEDDSLVFSNLGSFIPQTIENVIDADAPSEYYRNKFLVDAMVNLNMIDTIGSGIKKMFLSQKDRFFPLPEYDLSNNRVKVTIVGKVLDPKYARKLAQIPMLSLGTIMLLDKVQKQQKLSVAQAKELRRQKLIEGRSPNVYISSRVAEVTDQKSHYIRNRAFKDQHYKEMILDYLDTYAKASKADIDHLLLDILPDILDESQKRNKVRNLIYAMSKRDKAIVNRGSNRKPEWCKV